MFILSQKINPENILIFTTWEVRSELINPEGYGFNVYPIESMGLKINEMNQPFLFVLNSKWEVGSILLPDIYDQHRGYYFNYTLPSYFE